MKTLSLSSADIHRGKLILVNGNYPYHDQLGLLTLTHVGTGEIPFSKQPNTWARSQIKMDRNATSLLNVLMEEIDHRSKIIPVSGWRSKEEQAAIYQDSVKENGLAFTCKYVAKPDHSEHQTGLAIDLGLNRPDLDFIRPDFPYTGICQIFREKAPLYGFIERYPAEKEPITGIGHEPWHFRFVGMPHAAIMTDMKLTLEEYMAFVKESSSQAKPFRYAKKGCRVSILFIQIESGEETQIPVNPGMPYTLSGNNMDGVIVTQWLPN